MNYKKKLKTRLYIAITYIVLGLCMIAYSFIDKTPNDFVSTFGMIITVMGLVRIRNYILITKNEERIKKQQIKETDERNLLISLKARSTAFSIYFLLLGIAVIALSFAGLNEAAKWLSYGVLLLVIIHYICYFIYRKKL